MKQYEAWEIVEAWLKQNGFDGLYNSDAECGCLIGDLAPCGEIPLECTAGYKQPCDESCGDHDWHIGPKGEVVKEG
jgi:hypothetical protein